MSTLRESVKRILPGGMRDGVRYLTDARYRSSMRDARARKRRRVRVDALVKETAATLWTVTGGKIAAGPFQGMQYIRDSVGSQWAPKLLGTYEMELGSVIEDSIARAPARIVDIGAAEGYYAVGLAWRLPSTHVVAFEADEASHRLLRDMGASNGVFGRIQARGLCTRESLGEALVEGVDSLVICDVEGTELELLDPAQVPGLLKADVLAEIHPWADERASDILRGRFQATHDIREIHTRPRTIADMPSALPALPETTALACMDETRPCPMSWLWMTNRLKGCTP